MTAKLLEKDIKIILINYLLSRSHITLDDVVISEFTIDMHARRVDLLVIKDNLSIAFEIKSEFDSLIRFEGQIKKYQQYFDKVVVIAAPKHIEKIKSKTSSEVGLWEISPSGIISTHRKGRINRIKNKSLLLKFVPIRALRSISKQNSKEEENNLTVKEKIITQKSINYIRKLSLGSIRDKYIKYSSELIKKAKYNIISTQDLELLSPYYQKKMISKEKKEKKARSLRILKEIYSPIKK